MVEWMCSTKFMAMCLYCAKVYLMVGHKKTSSKMQKVGPLESTNVSMNTWQSGDFNTFCLDAEGGVWGGE